MDASDPKYPAVQRLMAYWLERPHAADTLEGICQWWFPGTPIPEPAVEQALIWLIERGVVVMRRAADARVRYHLADESGSGPC